MIKDESGVTLASVVVMIIIMLIIATTSIVVGNKVILEAREEQREQNLLIVKKFVEQENAKYEMGGVITPGNYQFIGIKNPIISKEDGTQVEAGAEWYLLKEEHLKGLGIEDAGEEYIVSYTYGEAVSTSNEQLYDEINRINDLNTPLN